MSHFPSFKRQRQETDVTDFANWFYREQFSIEESNLKKGDFQLLLQNIEDFSVIVTHIKQNNILRTF